MILLGKNEAGKSNLLKAIAAVFDKYKVSNKDKRKRINNEKINTEDYFVRAYFKLDPIDFKEIYNRFCKKYTGIETIKFKNLDSLEELISTIFFQITIKIFVGDNNMPSLYYWTPNSKIIELEAPVYLNGKKISTEPGINFDLVEELFEVVSEIYIEQNFNCIYWQFSENYLLPNKVDISSFIQKPSDYKGLENIFHLSNRLNIKEEFENSLSEDGDYSNLLQQVSEKVTTTFQRIWKDFKDTAIELLPDGDDILIKVVNKAKYSFEDRSDGFKKFISILLMLSTESRANKISEKDIILIDEPDQSLYPTSAKYLKDELIEISKKSIIVYSTHSQYMIDSNCLDRHLIVEKNDDVTVARIEDKNAPYSNDELLRRAIGSSIFECLQDKNIIFEGWLDKELFNKYCEYHKKSKDFNNIGISYLAGISGVETLVTLLILANKKFIIVADSDEASSKKRNEFIKNYPEHKESWIAYADVINSISTMEDFLEENHIENHIKLKGNNTFKYDSNKNAILNIEKAGYKDKESKQEIKNLLIANLSKNKIKTDYESFVVAVKNKISNL